MILLGQVVPVPKWVRWCLIGNVVGHGVDMGLTWWGIAAGHIFEVNPFLAPILARSPLLGAAIKMTAVATCSGILAWAYPQRPKLTTGALVLISTGVVTVLGLHVEWILDL